MITAVRSGRLDVDGERYRIRAGRTRWSETLLSELGNEPAVRQFFPSGLEELLGDELDAPEIEAAFAIIDAARTLAGLGYMPETASACQAIWTLVEPVVYPEEN